MSRNINAVQRFIFDNTDIRGEIVSLNQSYVDALAAHQYPEAVRQLLGELIAAAVLLSETLKFDGVLTLQARGNGPISLLMVECTSTKSFRAVSHFDESRLAGDTLQELLGEASLLVTVDPANGKRYQGIVPLEKANLGLCLEDYFEQSVQLPTRLWLACDGEGCAGFLLQALPPSVETSTDARNESWSRLTTLAETITDDELLQLSHEQVLIRLFHEEDVRLFDEEAVQFLCTCSWERSGKILKTLERAELDSIILEQGKIVMDCQFCNHHYEFFEKDIEALYSDTPTVH